MNRSLFWGMVRDWFLALAIVVVVLVLWNTLAPQSVVTGEEAPTFVLDGPSGEHLDLQTLHGQRVVINFWATWCPPCRDEIPAFSAFHAAHPEVALYGVSVDEGVSGKGLALKAEQLGITYPVLHDARSDVANSFRVQAIPTTVVINADGRIAAAHQGPLSQARLEALVSAP